MANCIGSADVVTLAVVVALGVCTLATLFVPVGTGPLDLCYANPSGLPNPLKIFNMIAFYTTQLTLCGYLVGIATWRPRHGVDTPFSFVSPNPAGFCRFGCRWPYVFMSLFVMTCYGCGSLLVNSGKAALGDRTCSPSKHYNSVSGHFHFYMFGFVAMPALTVSLRRNPHLLSKYWNFKLLRVTLGCRLRWNTALLYGTSCLFWLCGLAVLSVTYFGGYHSPRQIIYGSFMGLLNGYIIMPLLYWALPQDRKPQEDASALDDMTVIGRPRTVTDAADQYLTRPVVLALAASSIYALCLVISFSVGARNNYMLVALYGVLAAIMTFISMRCPMKTHFRPTAGSLVEELAMGELMDD